MKNLLSCFCLGFLLVLGCQSEPRKIVPEVPLVAVPAKIVAAKKTANHAATVLSKKEVPILCYHNIRDFSASASGNIKVYTVKPPAFAEQMKALADAGYQTILPEQLYNYLVFDGPLPAKPILITFDDTREEQFTIGAAEMKKYGFKGVFFIMTVSINRPGYLSKEQIKSLSDSGNVVAAHTWDHHMVTKYTGDDWNVQLVKPKAKLEEIIGKPVKDFAYPFGLWNTAAIPEIKKSGYEMGYILSTKRDTTDPLYTIRRIIVSGTWSTEGMMRSIDSSFK
ncbi:Polysaccharide deacetylase [Flavobacterium fryxellicola]|uniref:Polysaccharide deacetylase n=1 Tax=Flavobacterium fryxellicola TaxID=249352 RepID=A0A168AHF9_9FLAO|nr:polysaccharide deacetylase family protein [Flavobacterium fryxellicola]OAB31474.1 polysaccharide deacetylase [Flavobacterium fryxellicola]SHN53453.1 Polysaccharide deacetylase [Flavobacterium fryxellicola]